MRIAVRDDTHVYCNQQGAAAAPAEINVSGTGGDPDSPDDTGSTESVTEMNDTGARTPREADDIDVPDTGHDDLSGHMRQPEFPAARDHTLTRFISSSNSLATSSVRIKTSPSEFLPRYIDRDIKIYYCIRLQVAVRRPRDRGAAVWIHFM